MVRRTEFLFYQGSAKNTVLSRFSGKILESQKTVLHATKNSTLENCSVIVAQMSFTYRLPINPFSEVY